MTLGSVSPTTVNSSSRRRRTRSRSGPCVRRTTATRRANASSTWSASSSRSATSSADPDAARKAADADPGDVDGQLLVADLELLADHVDEAFARLVAVVRRTQGPDRERVRLRLLELFTVVGETDPSVMTARRALANALY